MIDPGTLAAYVGLALCLGGWVGLALGHLIASTRGAWVEGRED